MKKSLIVGFALGLTLLPVGTGLLAAEGKTSLPGTFSANVGFASDYIFRGISQSDEKLALQGGFDWSADNGFYVGVWGSSVDFIDGDEASIEVDYYAGYGGSIEQFSYDIGVIYYSYPGADDALNYDFVELALNLGYDFGPAAVSGGVFYSPDNFGGTDEALYTTAGIEVPLSEHFTASANFSHYEVEPSFGEDYNTWDIGLTFSFDWFDIDARYYDTDEDFCGDLCDERGVISVSRSF